MEDFVKARKLEGARLEFDVGKIIFDATPKAFDVDSKDLSYQRKHALARRQLVEQRSAGAQIQTTDLSISTTVESFFEPPTGPRRFALELNSLNGDPLGKRIVNGNWEFHLDDSHTGMPVYVSSCSGVNAAAITGDNVQTMCRQQGPILENFLNHRVQKIGGVPDLTETSMKQMLGREMLRVHKNEKAQIVAAIWDKSTWKIQLRYMRADAVMAKSWEWRSTVGCDLPDDFPDIPTTVALGKGRGSAPTVAEHERDIDGRYESQLPKTIKHPRVELATPMSEIRRRLKNRERLMTYVAFRLHGVITTEEKLREMVHDFEVEFGVASVKPQVSSDGIASAYTPIRTPLSNLHVRYEKRHMQFSRTKTMQQTLELRMGSRPDRPMEVCGGCAEPTSEADLKPDVDGRPVCSPCFTKTQDRDASTLVQLKRSLKASLRNELKSVDDAASAPNLTQLYADAEDFIVQAVDGNHFQDDYASGTMCDLPGLGHPYNPTIDACHIGRVDKQHGRVKYVLGNLVSTTVAANFGKLTHLVGSIERIADFWRETNAGTMSTAKLAAHMKTLLAEV
ncbi:hypothetical protein LTR95_010837 [Oleoguttula sp. CCFEE 5521]